MTEIKGILLVPADPDPHGLLTEGPCGARPPFAVRIRYGDMKTLCYVWRAGPFGGMSGLNPRALVLAWDGKQVPEGMAALERAWGVTRTSLPWWVRCYLRHPRGPETVVGLAGWLSRVDCPGTIILIDGDGREVTNDK